MEQVATPAVHGSQPLLERYTSFFILSVQPLTPRNVERFGGNYLIARDRRVTLIGLSGLLGRDPVGAVPEEWSPSTWDELARVFAAEGTESLLLLYDAPVGRLGEIVKSWRGHTCYFDRGRLPMHRWFAGLRNWIRGRRPTMALDYYVRSCLQSEREPPPWLIGARTSLNAASWDHELWRRAEPFASLEPYAVFLDQALPEHTDYVVNAVHGGNPFDAATYYPRIRDLLRRAEQTFGLQVRVARHPRAPVEPNPWTGFEVHREMTASLVKGAKLVIAHDSTATSFAVLSRVPLLLVWTPEQGRTHVRHVAPAMSRALRVPLVPITAKWLPMPDVDFPRYARYETDFLRHPRAGTGPLWDDIFATHGPLETRCR